MRIVNYELPQEKELSDSESRYFLPKELVDEIAYAAERGKEAFDRISGNVENTAENINSTTTPTPKKDKNISKPLIYISGAALIGVALYLSYRFYNQKKGKK
jgi:hypothetical protein